MCRLLKRLRKKDKKQVQLERKEKGFSIYVNGANTDSQVPSQAKGRPRVKTATGMYQGLVMQDSYYSIVDR